MQPARAPEPISEEPPSKAVLWTVRIVLALILLVLILFLRETDRPWKKGLESLSEAARPGTKHFIVSGLYWAALGNAIVTGVLLLTMPLWLRVRKRAESKADRPARQAVLRFWIPVALAIVCGAIMGLPRLSLSLWGDEEHTLRTYIMGRFERNDAGEIVEKPNHWQRSLWAYINPNNHILNTVLARLSLGIWRSTWDGQGLPFNETALRLPGFLAALAGIAMLAYLLRSLGFTRAGIVAAWLCALHPWYLRYATECRGYAYMLLLLPASLLCLLLLWKDPQWRWGLLLGLCEFLLLYAYPGALYAVILANAAFLAALLMRGGKPDPSWAMRVMPVARRWLVGSLAGAMVFLQLYAPCIPQLLRYLKARAGVEQPTMGWPWVQDFLSLVLTGTRWSFSQPENSIVVTMADLLQRQGWLWVVLGLAAVAAVLGFVRFIRVGQFATYLAIALAASIAVTFWVAKWGGNFLYYWYLIFALPIVIMFMALGIDQFGGWFVRRGWKSTGLAAPTVFLVAYAVLTSPQRHVLRVYPVEAQRESVLRTRPTLTLKREDVDSVLTFGMARGGSQMMTVPSYDPGAYYVDDAESLRELMLKADAENKPLFANIAMPALARIAYPEVMNILDNPSVFQLVKFFDGLEDNVTRYIYQYNRGSVQAYERHQPTP
jgi:hypothetical protein